MCLYLFLPIDYIIGKFLENYLCKIIYKYLFDYSIVYLIYIFLLLLNGERTKLIYKIFMEFQIEMTITMFN